MPNGATSAAVSGSSRTMRVRGQTVEWSSHVGSVGSAAVTMAHAETGAATAQVRERRQRARVRPLEIVEHENDRSVLGDDGDERLENLDLVEPPLGRLRRELGEDLAECRCPSDIELEPSNACRSAAAIGT